MNSSDSNLGAPLEIQIVVVGAEGKHFHYFRHSGNGLFLVLRLTIYIRMFSNSVAQPGLDGPLCVLPFSLMLLPRLTESLLSS